MSSKEIIIKPTAQKPENAEHFDRVGNSEHFRIADSPKSRVGRPRKYNTPEEVHKAKLEQMRQWRLKRKEAKNKATAAGAESSTDSPSDGENPIKSTYRITLEFETDEERQQFIKSHSLTA